MLGGTFDAAGNSFRWLNHVLLHDERIAFWTGTSRANGLIPKHRISDRHSSLHVLLQYNIHSEVAARVDHRNHAFLPSSCGSVSSHVHEGRCDLMSF